MHILLINSNPVVSRLISLCLKDKPGELHEVSSLDEVEERHYDLAFIDDASYAEITPIDLQVLSLSKCVLLSAQTVETDDIIDHVIKKPFLPSKITEMIDSLQESVLTQDDEEISEPAVIEPEDVPHIFPLSSEETQVEEQEEAESFNEAQDDQSGHEILDLHEIERIKSLLDMEEDEAQEDLLEKDEDELESLKREVIKQNLIEEGLEIVDEEDVIEAVENKLSIHITHDKQGSQDQQREFEKKLLDAVKKMKKKKLKKLLKGAEVTINIRFKDSEQ